MLNTLGDQFRTGALSQTVEDLSAPNLKNLDALFKSLKNELVEYDARAPFYLFDWSNRRVYLTATLRPLGQPVRSLSITGWEPTEPDQACLRVVSSVDNMKVKEISLGWQDRNTALLQIAADWLQEYGSDFTRQKLLAPAPR